MFWSEFLKSKLPQIGVFFIIFGIYLSNFLLWHLPLMALLNSTLFVIIIFVIYLVSSYFRFRNNAIYIRDLTNDRERLYKEISDKELQEKEFEDIVKIWSHQMKVPLAAIDLMTQTGEVVQSKQLKNQVFQLENYLKILLEYQRISNLSTDFRAETFSTATLIKKIIRKYSTFFIQKGLSVKIEGDWQMTSDQRWLEIALEQFINNAVKYTSKGGILIEIQEGKISIMDTGIGILKEDVPRLFEHGFTGYNGRVQQKSTGLGLYLSKMILEKLDLTITIDSEIEKGTRVEITPTN